jgi:hypothetical protein
MSLAKPSGSFFIIFDSVREINNSIISLYRIRVELPLG